MLIQQNKAFSQQLQSPARSYSHTDSSSITRSCGCSSSCSNRRQNCRAAPAGTVRATAGLLLYQQHQPWVILQPEQAALNYHQPLFRKHQQKQQQSWAQQQQLPCILEKQHSQLQQDDVAFQLHQGQSQHLPLFRLFGFRRFCLGFRV
jgi:hypothetical protein